MNKKKVYVLVDKEVLGEKDYIYFKFLREDLPYLKQQIKEMEDSKYTQSIYLIGKDTKRRL